MAYTTVSVAGTDINRGDALRTAMAAAADGDTIYAPGVAAGSGYDIQNGTLAITNKGIRLIGEGKLTNIIHNTLAFHSITITNPAAPGGIINNLQLLDFNITGNSNAANLAGISFVGSAANAFNLWAIKRVNVSGMQDGINFDNTHGSGAVGLGAHLNIEDCNVSTHSRWGISLFGMSMPRIVGTEVNTCGKQGIRVITCPNLSIRDSASEGNNTSNDAVPENSPQILVKLSHGFLIDNVDIESMPTSAGATKAGVVVSQCLGGAIRCLNVAQQAFQSDSIGIHLMNAPCSGISVDELKYSFITTPILVDSGCEHPWIRNAGIIKAAP